MPAPRPATAIAEPSANTDRNTVCLAEQDRDDTVDSRQLSHASNHLVETRIEPDAVGVVRLLRRYLTLARTCLS